MSQPYYETERVTLWHGDVLDVLRELSDASVDAVVTDPPYELGFMGKRWDASGIAYSVELWSECLRVLKSGGHLLSFGGSRTWHRLTAAVEDAGFEIRDSIAWLYGSGFPKSLDVAKAITAAERVGGSNAGAVRRAVMGDDYTPSGRLGNRDGAGRRDTGAAERWVGWGTALKPAFEPIIVARKPLAGTVAANVLEYGTGALNIDACRIPYQSNDDKASARPGGLATSRPGALAGKAQACDEGHGSTELSTSARTRDTPANSTQTEPDVSTATGGQRTTFQPTEAAGRWPTNVVLDEATAASLDEQTGVTTSRSGQPRAGQSGDGWGMTATGAEYDDVGGASRFFPTFRYEAKADAAERPRVNGVAHPTVKPLELMRWLVRLVTPPGGTVLEPFAGSGTTVEACLIEGFRCIAVEREADYLLLIEARTARRTNAARALELANEDMGLFGLLDEDGAA